MRPSLRIGCCEWMAGPLLEAGVRVNAIDVYECNDTWVWYGFDGEGVQPFRVPHNVPNCGYRIRLPLSGEQIFYATDCATLDGIEAKDYDYYLIESNHTRAEIEARIAAKRAAGEFAYEEQAMRNHLSYEQAVEWLAANDSRFPNGNYEFLHQHQERSEKYGISTERRSSDCNDDRNDYAGESAEIS